jgi:G3E family GTPase
VLLEGFSDGKPCLVDNDHLIIARIATGCLCCSNNMIMRIYLNRLIHQKPQRLFLGLSTDTHLDQITQFFNAPDYAKIIALSKILKLS